MTTEIQFLSQESQYNLCVRFLESNMPKLARSLIEYDTYVVVKAGDAT